MSNTPSRAEIEALVKRHGATSYRNRADRKVRQASAFRPGKESTKPARAS